MKVRTSATLPCSIDAAFEALHTPGVFRAVSAPFTVFRTKPGEDLPERFALNRDYPVTVMAGGVIPMGTQDIHLVDEIDSWAARSVTDRGRGVSGPLRGLRNWNHRMSVRALPDGTTDFSDELTADAGWLTPFAWLGLQVFWLWRGMRLRSLSRSFDSDATKSWNQRYRENPSMWSGKVNPVLKEVASELTPGHALDVGCGEGADALFLAEQGFNTLGVDASSVSLYRAHQEATRRAASSGHAVLVDWRVADISLPWTWRKDLYDFVSLQFIHTDQATRSQIWSEAMRAVAPGGTLLIVGHDADDATKGIRRPPADRCFDAEELVSAVPKDWSEVRAFSRSRIQIFEGEDVEVSDVVLVAKR